MTAQLLTASRLREGDVVYFTAAGHWSEWLSDATVADAEADDLLARGPTVRADLGKQARRRLVPAAAE